MTDKAKTKRKTKRRDKSENLQTHVTFLEMTSPLTRMPMVPTRPPIALIHAQNIQPHFYSYIYELVGKPHHWEERRNLDPTRLFEVVNESDVDISILYVEGCPAGFFELNLRGHPEAVELKYVGIAPDYQGLGIGKWFCAAAISAAWSHKPDKVKVETNTLDHPAALPIYQKLGFSPVAVADTEIAPWI